MYAFTIVVTSCAGARPIGYAGNRPERRRIEFPDRVLQPEQALY